MPISSENFFSALAEALAPNKIIDYITFSIFPSCSFGLQNEDHPTENFTFLIRELEAIKCVLPQDIKISGSD